jgi:hypothetical protein
MPVRTTRTEEIDLCRTPDRRTFVLGAEQWNAFLDALEAPPRHLPQLERLLEEPGFFDAVPK